MKPLPDLQDTEAMAAIGRTSALWSARNQAMSELRDVFTAMQSAEFGVELRSYAAKAEVLCGMLVQIAAKWENESARTANPV
jgi:hypothetical protein